MYLGHMVELADAAEIYDHPLHPYSKALISAVPVPDPVVARANRRIQMTGEIPSPLNAPPGCPFHTRCPYAKDSCKESMPELREIYILNAQVESLEGLDTAPLLMNITCGEPLASRIREAYPDKNWNVQ